MVGYDAVVLRVGEIFLKGDNRHLFVKRLVDNLTRRLKQFPWRVEQYQGRVLATPRQGMDPTETLDEVLEICASTFGIVSASPAVLVTDPSLEALSAVAATLAKATVPPGAKTFRVLARRADKRLPFSSQDMGRVIGSAVWRAIGLKVDLGSPDFVVGVEVGKRSFVYTRVLEGPGGLPVGSSANTLLLLSGGIDSPVAGYMAMKRGSRIEAINFHSPPYTGPAARKKVEDLARVLARWGTGSLTVHRIPITSYQVQVRDHAPRRLSVLLYRRLMIRAACRVAETRGCKALVTGESLGQVASQTVENLACIEAVADRPILRPLVAFDKAETVALARRIGSYEISIRPHEDSCSLFVPKHPEIHGRVADLERAEAKLPLAEELDAALDAMETVTIEV